MAFSAGCDGVRAGTQRQLTVEGASTPMRWAVKVTNHDRTYYSFRCKPWPEARIHGEPGSPEFEACYQSLPAASTAAEVERIRDRTTKKQRKRHDYFGADAILAWAGKEPLTLEQAQHVRRALGIPSHELLQ